MIAAIIQARLGSSRLPGKVLKNICGKPMLEHLLERVKRAKSLDKIIVATTEKPEDGAVAELAKNYGVEFFRGSEKDVLDRYYQTAKKFSVTHIVRLTGDCPLMDPEIINEVVNFYVQNLDKYDYVSNVHPPTYPDGMDVEAFSIDVLEKSRQEAELPSEREHVTAYIGNHPEIFRACNVKYKTDVSGIRLTVDNREDFAVMSSVFRELYAKNENFNLDDILNLYKENPEIFSANSRIKRNEGYAKSVREDEF
ncbi:MAG: glycosyltransferase family protein [Candidatus Niyogibacteria bacterium]|nr:MAG: glycosyltransferase family protein [Candidatus Niyogibacteria bacterium]